MSVFSHIFPVVQIYSREAYCCMWWLRSGVLSQVPLAPEWLIAAALSEAVKHPIQVPAESEHTALKAMIISTSFIF